MLIKSKSCMSFIILVVFAFVLPNCSGGGGSSVPGVVNTTTLSGAWLLPGGDAYFTADDAGVITDIGGYDTAGGTYLVSNNTFSITFNYNYGSAAHINGTLVTSTTASASVAQGANSFLTDVIKVSDPGACQGSWTGTLTEAISNTTYTINLTVDASGIINSGSLPGISGAGVSGRKLYCESMQVMGFIATVAAGPYSQIQITGSGNGAAIIGTYTTSGSPSGTIQLVNSANTHALSNTKLTGSWLLSAEAGGIYTLETDGTGSITDFSGLKPGGSYSVYADDTLTMKFGEPAALATGRLTSATMGSLVIENVGTATLIKVADPGACQGNWTGTLNFGSASGAIDFTVNASGIITGGTFTEGSGTYPIVSDVTRMYCASGHAAGGILIDDSGSYHYLQLMGSGNGTAIVGNFTDPSTEIGKALGVINLVKTSGTLPVDYTKFAGPWLLQTPAGAVYLQADGTGTVNEFSIAGVDDPAGAYSAYTNNSLFLTIIGGSKPVAFMTGQLTSVTTALVTITEADTGSTHATRLIKVADPGACQGTWTGTITETNSSPTYTIDLTVDATGAITTGSIQGLANVNSGNHLYCQSGLAAGFLATDAIGLYSQVQIAGSGNGTAITGHYATASGGPSGSINLVNTNKASARNNALLTNMSWLLLGDPNRTFYLRTDGTGMITEFSGSGFDVPPGRYSAYTNNTLIMTILSASSPLVFMTGQLTSNGTIASLASTETGTTTTNIGTLMRVSDTAACQGNWTGTWNNGGGSGAIDLTVDGAGNITGGSLTVGSNPYAITSSGTKLYCESGHAAGFMMFNTLGDVQLTGALYGTTISGSYTRNGFNVPAGSMILTKH